MTFNLKHKRAYMYGPMYTEEAMAEYLWNAFYELDGTYDSPQSMIMALRDVEGGIQGEFERRNNPEPLQQNTDKANVLEVSKEQMQGVFNIASKKPFNVKQAIEALPFQHDNFNDTGELGEEQFDMQQDSNILEPQEGQKRYETHYDLNEMLLQAARVPDAFQIAWNNIIAENPKEPDSAQSALKSYFQGFETKGEEQRLDEADLIHKLIYGKEDIMTIDAPYKKTRASVNEVSNIIKKLAQKHVGKHEKKAFNVTKTAQHKTMDNAILWGPGQTRIDPFLHQPVSDWHIVERNKGFGLVVDDVWNIDYETIWRENVMDKYSRPYRDKEGNWVGGYIQKRFEVDKNIPVTSNIQLKPGQTRKPILPEYGNTESRLQAARAKGDIAGATDTSKPFNWKEASSKKKS